MGYTGSIYVNGSNVLKEWKSTGTYYGQYYATAYLKHIWTEIDLGCLHEVLGNVCAGDRFTDKTETQIYYSSKFIYHLKDLISNKYRWKNNLFDGVIYVNSSREEISLCQLDRNGDPITNNPPFQASKYAFHQAFGNDKDGDKYYEELKNLNSFTREYLIKLVNIISHNLEKNQIHWLQNKNKNQNIMDILTQCIRMIENGDTIKVRFLPGKKNIFQIASKNNGTIDDIKVDDEYPLYDLFETNELYCLGADCKITSKYELGKLIYYFGEVKSRNMQIEKVFTDLYNSINDNDVIDVRIYGSF